MTLNVNISVVTRYNVVDTYIIVDSMLCLCLWKLQMLQIIGLDSADYDP